MRINTRKVDKSMQTAQQTNETGTVKMFNEGRGFGFIIPGGNNAGAKDIFAHVSEVIGKTPLKEGDVVEYRSESTQKGIVAKSIRIIKRVAAAA